MANMKNEYELDAAVFSSEDMADFSEFLDEREANASWDEIRVCEVTVIPHTRDVCGISEVSRREAIYAVTTPVGKFALRDIAEPSLLERARISGYALGELTSEDFSDIVTRCLKTSSDTTNIRMQDGKLSAFMANSYKKLPQPDVYETAMTVIDREFAGEFITASWSHRMTMAKYRCSILSSDFQKIFSGKGLNISELEMGILVATSDNGYSGLNIFPELTGIMTTGRRLSLPILGEIAMPHKGNNVSLEKFAENLTLVFAKAEESKERLKEMDQIILDYPFNAFCNALKKSGIGKKAAKQAIDTVAVLYGNGGTATAADLYFRAAEVAYSAEDQMQEMAIMESVSKFLKFSNSLWEKEFDRPVNCWSFSVGPM